ncbi:hypothetical protein [Mesorhizobium sp. B1-1-7]|uniref:hypothetical protein n=1 Tax=Mesorhizobium sp. B1-1-7 TaxID=2589977 RepID=UPI001126AC52|nr:hypothetical protein [Mesorhizobium sp. B1-1-7]TPN44858.1 hypothetical protein FJ978_28165 [Mesorhizobium sp. B1-1-7]
MILSSAAQMLNASGSDIPTLARINFLTGSYVVNDVTVTAADVIDRPELVTANGLEIVDEASPVAIIGDMLDILLTADWTIVIEWDHFDDNGNIYPLVLSGPGSDNSIVLRRYAFSFAMDLQDYSGSNFREATDGEVVGDGIHRVALTRTDAKLAFSIDGRAVVSDTSISFGISPTSAAIGDASGILGDIAITIRSLTVLAPQDDSLLPSLSA